MNAGTWTVLPGDDALLGGPCAVVRWLRVLDLVVTRPGKRDLSGALKKAKPVTTRSPHLCRSTRTLDPATLTVPLLPPIDQWGYVPFPVQRLTPHSLSRRARDLLAGDLGAHRDLPVDTDDESETPAPVTPAVSMAVYTKADAQRAWERRRADLMKLPASMTSSIISTPEQKNSSNGPRRSWPRKPTVEHPAVRTRHHDAAPN